MRKGIQSVRGRYGRKLSVIEAYGGSCQHCGIDDPDVLTIDHTENNGAEERKNQGAKDIWAFLKRRGCPEEGYQLLCANCNLKKEVQRRRGPTLQEWNQM